MNNIEALENMKKGNKVFNDKNENMCFEIVRLGEVRSDFGDIFKYNEWLKLTTEDNQELGWNTISK